MFTRAANGLMVPRDRQTLKHRSAEVALSGAAKMTDASDQARLHITGSTSTRAGEVGERLAGIVAEHAALPELNAADRAKTPALLLGHEHGFDAIAIRHIPDDQVLVLEGVLALQPGLRPAL